MTQVPAVHTGRWYPTPKTRSNEIQELDIMRTIIQNTEDTGRLILHATKDGKRPFLEGDLDDGTTYRGEMGIIIGTSMEIGGLVYPMDSIRNMTQINV